jgi:cytochrome c553
MNQETPLSLKDHWVVRSVTAAAAIFVGAAVLGFMVFPLKQPNAQASSLWDAICSAAGVVGAPTSEKPIEPQFTVSPAVMTSDMLRGADAESIGRGAMLAHQCAICHGPTGISRADSPNLAGQYAGVIYKELKDFQSGARVNAVMSPFALGLLRAGHDRSRFVLRLSAPPASLSSRRASPLASHRHQWRSAAASRRAARATARSTTRSEARGLRASRLFMSDRSLRPSRRTALIALAVGMDRCRWRF